MPRTKMTGAIFFLLLIPLAAICACTTGSRSEAPILWQEEEAGINEQYFAADGGFTSYRMPPAERLSGAENDPCRENTATCPLSPATLTKDFFLGPDPLTRRRLFQRETALLNGVSRHTYGDGEILGQEPKAILGTITTFQPASASETITRTFPIDTANPGLGCSEQSFTYNALDLGDDPPPGLGDNFTFFKQDITLDDYRSAMFDTGPNAGYDSARADLGGIDLSGFSLNNYLIEMNYPGTYEASGDILPASLVLPHAHEYYGYATYSEDGGGDCVSPFFSDNNRGAYLQDTLDAMTAEYDDDPTIDWTRFDADGDKIVDLLAIIHAGYGFQEGGGEDRLTTLFGEISPPRQVVGFTTPGDTSDDYYIEGYTILSENLDIGALQEEFEHLFGIADYYTLDVSNSNSFWTSHSQGNWGGSLGGARPVGDALHQAWLLDRKSPLVIDYDDIPTAPAGAEDSGQFVTLGRARYTPQGTEDGVIIRLPQKQVTVQNNAGSGSGWYSGTGDLLDNRLYRSFDLRQAAAPITFSLDAWWDIETDYDYGLLELSRDGGQTWTTPDPLQGALTDHDAHARGIVAENERWGLTGAGHQTLAWDLSPYEGQQLTLRLRYLTDTTGSGAGLFVDNLRLADSNSLLYENDLEKDFSDWTSAGWQVTPTAESYEHYYLLEWRDDNGFDQSLNDPYQTKYLKMDVPPPAKAVDRLPATTPSLIVAYRDQSQPFDYYLKDSHVSGSSIGPKFGHLVIDAHPFPQQWDAPDPNRANLTGRNLSGRVMAGDAGFGLVQTQPWTASREYDPTTGLASETKQWTARQPFSTFHDSYGYFPGLFYDPGSGNYYYWHSGASAVLPAKGVYSTRITDVNGAPLTSKYGEFLSGYPLGTGNPGDAHVHYGLHVEVVESTAEQGLVRIWKSFYETEMGIELGSLTYVSDTAKMAVAINENIGGKLEEPRLVVTLPDNVRYVEGSASGGFKHETSNNVRRMIWTGDDIGTRTAVDLGDFLIQRTGTGTVTFQIDLYHRTDEHVQSTTITAHGQGVFMPMLINR